MTESAATITMVRSESTRIGSCTCGERRMLAPSSALEVPDDAPEDERWELLLVEEDEQLRGHLVYREIQLGQSCR